MFVLGPPEGLEDPPDSPLIVRSAGPDDVLGTSDDPFAGLVYGVVPEPDAAWLLVAALGSAALLARARSTPS